MRFSLSVDLWDLAAAAAVAAVLFGLFSWHWPAGLVALGVSFLALYAYREFRLAPQPPDESERR